MMRVVRLFRFKSWLFVVLLMISAIALPSYAQVKPAYVSIGNRNQTSIAATFDAQQFHLYDVAPEMYKAVDAVVPFMQEHLL